MAAVKHMNKLIELLLLVVIVVEVVMVVVVVVFIVVVVVAESEMLLTLYFYYYFLTYSLPNSTMVDLLIMFKIANVDLSRSKYVCAQLR
jgi:hypothetical protein